MQRWQRTLVVALVVWMAAVVAFSLRPRQWHGELAGTAPVQYVTVTCGPAWGSGYVHAPEHLSAPVAGTPCGDRQSMQLTSGLDVVVTLGVLLGLMLWTRRRAGDPA